MNKAFKVLWNQVRNTYVVASEAQTTHGKPSKATKTLVAAAVAGLMVVGGTAFAKDITYDYLTDEEGTSKFISGNGEELVIKTEGDARELALALKSGTIEDIRNALGVHDGKATLVGLAGGVNKMDELTPGVLLVAGAGLNEDQASMVYKLMQQITPFNGSSLQITGDTFIKNDGTSNPLLVATVGGDRLMNMSLAIETVDVGADAPTDFAPGLTKTIERTGNTNIEFSSGNLIGTVGGSSAINVGGLTLFKPNVTIPPIPPLFPEVKTDIYVKLQGAETTTKINGSTNISFTGSTSSAGTIGAGSAIAITGKANSIVTDGSNITIDTTAYSSGYEGLHAGVVGGGLSIATMGGESSATVGGTTTIDLKNGAVLGVLGGGVAASAEVSSVLDKVLDDQLSGYKDNILLDETLKEQGGKAEAVSGDVHIIVGEKSEVAGIVGGGLAAAQQMFDSTKPSSAKVEVGNVQIDIGSENAAPVFANEQEKIDYHNYELSPLLDEIKEYVKNPNGSSIGEFGLLKEIVDTAKPGMTIGVLGGGMALGYQANNGSDAEDRTQTVTSTSIVKDVAINVHSGYNIGIFGSGLAASSAASYIDPDTEQTTTKNAVSEVGNVVITLDGGDTVGVMGGGISFFTGTGEPNTGISAEATTVSSNILVEGDAIVDGLVGGGLAIDDSNPKDANGPVATKNASSTVTTANIQVDSGNVGYIHFEVFHPEQPVSDPGLSSYWNSLTYVMNAEKAAITGGGLAAGGQGSAKDTTGAAHVDTVNITLNGTQVVTDEGSGPSTVIDGNVYGGGIATDGGWSSVGTANITVDGAHVTGDIYGGGLALEGTYKTASGADDTYNNQSKTTVDTVNIWLQNGAVEGNVYAGGLVSAADGEDTAATSEVGTANVMLYNDQVLGETSTVDGSGAETANMILASETGAFAFADGQKVVAFDNITSTADVIGMNYDFGAKDTTNVVGTVNFASITGDNTKTMNIGTTESAGIASISSGPAVTTKFNVANGLLALNSDTTDAALSAFSGAGVKNALYVTGTVKGDWSVAVGENAQATETGIVIGSNGALIADADGHTVVETGVTMAEGSKIHFADVAKAAAQNAQVNIAVDPEAATSVDNVLYTVSGSTVGNLTRYTFTQRTGSELEEVGLGDVDDTEALVDIAGQDDSASDYINNFLDESTSSVNNGNRSQQINAAMNLAAAAGVQTVAIDSATMGIDAAAKRASLINNFAEGGVLFAEATGKRFEMGGSSDFGAIKTELGGIVVGGEYTTGDWTFGALANLGTGTVRGQDANSGVKNDVDYYGVQAYAAKRLGAFNVVGQVGYVQTSNDVTHTTVGMEKADIDADVMSVGVRGEMRFDLTQNTRLVPYIGVNYLRVSTDGFHTDQGLEVKDQDQDLVTIPVGVKFAGDMQTASGWTWTPSVDVGYVAALGDRDTDARTKVGATTVHTSMDVWSESVVRTSVGLKAQKDNWGFGVQAGSAMGSDDTKELFGQVRVDYRF